MSKNQFILILTSQSEVDARITDIIDMEDVNVLPDLQALIVFWAECAKFLSEDVGTSVDDRRHGLVAHLARAISIKDLVNGFVSSFGRKLLPVRHRMV